MATTTPQRSFESADTWTHFWRVRKWLPDRCGQRCRIIAAGKLNKIEVEFEDGARFFTIRYFVRKIPRHSPNSESDLFNPAARG
jgi:hypothetical protein